MKPIRNFRHDEFLFARAGYIRSGDRKIVIRLPPGVFPMVEFAKAWFTLKVDRRAVTALEYGLIAGVIVATITVGFSLLANSLSESFSAIGDSL
jgi:Flp pilus assembly pilin Flp